MKRRVRERKVGQRAGVENELNLSTSSQRDVGVPLADWQLQVAWELSGHSQGPQRPCRKNLSTAKQAHTDFLAAFSNLAST